MPEQNWIAEAKKHVGVQEVANKALIQGWAKKMGPKWYADQVDPSMSDGFGPWCGLFTAWCVHSAGAKLPENYFRASSWATWGQELKKPAAGCVVTFTRNGGGHVGFVLGVDKTGALLVIGGNQGNKVCVEKFPLAKATAFRWPAGVALPTEPAPVLAINAALSVNQA